MDQKMPSPSPPLKTSLMFTHTPRADPVKSGAIFRQDLQFTEGSFQQQQTVSHPPSGRPFGHGVNMHNGGQRSSSTRRLGLESDPGAINSPAFESGLEASRLTANPSGLHSNPPVPAPPPSFPKTLNPASSPLLNPPQPSLPKTANPASSPHPNPPQPSFSNSGNQRPIPSGDNNAILRPSPYGRFLPHPSPTPFGVAAWASSNMGQQISANFDALVRQSPAPRVLRNQAQSPPQFRNPTNPQQEVLITPNERQQELIFNRNQQQEDLLIPNEQHSLEENADEMRPQLDLSPRRSAKQEFQQPASSPRTGQKATKHRSERKGKAANSPSRLPRSGPVSTGGLSGGLGAFSLSPDALSAEAAIEDWYLAALPSKSQGEYALGVGGSLLGEIGGLEKWISGPVVQRLGPQQVMLSDGRSLVLFGPLNYTRTSEQGFGEAVLKGFSDGFPVTWQELIRQDGARKKKGIGQPGAGEAVSEGGPQSPGEQAAPGLDSNVGPESGNVDNLDGVAKDANPTKPALESALPSPALAPPTSPVLNASLRTPAQSSPPKHSLESSRRAAALALPSSPILNAGLQAPVQLQPSSVLKSHGKKSTERESANSDRNPDKFLTPVAATPRTRSRSKAGQGPPSTGAERNPPSSSVPVTNPSTKSPKGNTAVGSPSIERNTVRLSGREPAKGLSAFLFVDEEDEADFGYPPLEDDTQKDTEMPEEGGNADGTASVRLRLEPEEETVPLQSEAVAGADVGELAGGKEDSERTESDRPIAGPDEGTTVDTFGEATSLLALGGPGDRPKSVQKNGKSQKGVRKASGEGLTNLDGTTEGLEKRPENVRRSTRGVRIEAEATPKTPAPERKGLAADEPNFKGPLFVDPPETDRRVNGRNGRRSKGSLEKSMAETPGASGSTAEERAQRREKRRKVPEEKATEFAGVEGKEEDLGGGSGDGRSDGGATLVEVVRQEASEAKPASETKRSRILRELESMLIGPEDDVTVTPVATRGVKLPEAAQLSKRGRLVAPKLAFWENEYYDRDQAGRIVGFSRPAVERTPPFKPSKPFSPKTEPGVKKESSEADPHSGSVRHSQSASKGFLGIRKRVKEEVNEADVRNGKLRKGKSNEMEKEVAVKEEKGSPTGSSSPGRWVSRLGKRKLLEEGHEGEKDGPDLGLLPTEGEMVLAAKKRTTAGDPEPSDGSKPSNGRRRSTDQLWRLQRYKLPKSPRAVLSRPGRNAADVAEKEGDQRQGTASEGLAAEAAEETISEEAEEITPADEEKKDEGKRGVGPTSKETESGKGVHRHLRGSDNRSGRGKTDALSEVPTDPDTARTEKAPEKQGKKGTGPVGGEDGALRQEKVREGRLQGPVEDLRVRKKERRVSEIPLAEGEQIRKRAAKLDGEKRTKQGGENTPKPKLGGGRKARGGRGTGAGSGSTEADVRGEGKRTSKSGNDVSKGRGDVSKGKSGASDDGGDVSKRKSSNSKDADDVSKRRGEVGKGRGDVSMDGDDVSMEGNDVSQGKDDVSKKRRIGAAGDGTEEGADGNAGGRYPSRRLRKRSGLLEDEKEAAAPGRKEGKSPEESNGVDEAAVAVRRGLEKRRGKGTRGIAAAAAMRQEPGKSPGESTGGDEPAALLATGEDTGHENKASEEAGAAEADVDVFEDGTRGVDGHSGDEQLNPSDESLPTKALREDVDRVSGDGNAPQDVKGLPDVNGLQSVNTPQGVNAPQDENGLPSVNALPRVNAPQGVKPLGVYGLSAGVNALEEGNSAELECETADLLGGKIGAGDKSAYGTGGSDGQKPNLGEAEFDAEIAAPVLDAVRLAGGRDEMGEREPMQGEHVSNAEASHVLEVWEAGGMLIDPIENDEAQEGAFVSEGRAAEQPAVAELERNADGATRMMGEVPGEASAGLGTEPNDRGNEPGDSARQGERNPDASAGQQGHAPDKSATSGGQQPRGPSEPVASVGRDLIHTTAEEAKLGGEFGAQGNPTAVPELIQMVNTGPIHTGGAEPGGTGPVNAGNLGLLNAGGLGPVNTGGAGPIHTGGTAPLDLGNVGLVKAGGLGRVNIGGAGPVHTAPPQAEPVDATGWTARQVAALRSAMGLIDPDAEGFWNKVARQVAGKTATECQAKHNAAYATPPVRPPQARRAAMSPPPRIIIQGAGKGLAKAANQNKPRGFVTIQMQGVRAVRDILRAQQAKQREVAGDPLAFDVGSQERPGSTGLSADVGSGMMPAVGGAMPAVIPPVFKPVQNQEKYIDDALQRRLQAQRRKSAASQGGAAASPGFGGLSEGTMTEGAADSVAGAGKAPLAREEGVANFGQRLEVFPVVAGDANEEDDEMPCFA